LIHHFILNLRDLHNGQYKRAVYYFAKGDPRIEEYLSLPDFKEPGLIRDVYFKYCGGKLRGSKGYDEFLKTVPSKYRDRCSKSEKGVDTELCCDALQLSATGKLERLFLLTNDSDFIPLCKRLRDFGSNVSLLSLSESNIVNKELVKECDTYDTLVDGHLREIFGVETKKIIVK